MDGWILQGKGREHSTTQHTTNATNHEAAQGTTHNTSQQNTEQLTQRMAVQLNTVRARKTQHENKQINKATTRQSKLDHIRT